MQIKWIDKITDTKNNDITGYLFFFFVVIIVFILPTMGACMNFGWRGLLWPIIMIIAMLGGAGMGENMRR